MYVVDARRTALRRLRSRSVLEIDVVCRTPLHVGAAEEGLDSDFLIALDGRGQPYIPGTSLAGALRSWCRQALGAVLTDTIWGTSPERGDAGAAVDNTTASLIYVEDGHVTLPTGATIEGRPGVGIDRRSGAAASRIKFGRETVPRGTTIRFSVTGEEVANEDGPVSQTGPSGVERILATILQGLLDGEIRLGAATTRGLGRVALSRLEARTAVLSSREGILATLRSRLPSGEWAGLRWTRDSRSTETGAAAILADLAREPGFGWLHPEIVRAQLPPRLVFTLAWKPDGPVMVKADLDGLMVDTFPLTGSIDAAPHGGAATGAERGRVALVLPGSGTKGALRSHAERIVRTLLGGEVAPGADFMDQLTPAPLVGALFGDRGKGKRQDEGSGDRRRERDEHSAGALMAHLEPGRAALLVDDCYSRHAIPADAWRAVLMAQEHPDGRDGRFGIPMQPMLDAVTRTGLENLEPVFHVAVDRWTGGAAEGLLFSVLEPQRVDWEPLRFELDLTRLRPEDQMPVLALLFLVLEDFRLGRLPLGYGANRGLGAVCEKETLIDVSARGIAGPPPQPESCGWCLHPDLAGAVSGLQQYWRTGQRGADLDRLEQAWSVWIEENAESTSAGRPPEEATS